LIEREKLTKKGGRTEAESERETGFLGAGSMPPHKEARFGEGGRERLIDEGRKRNSKKKEKLRGGGKGHGQVEKLSEKIWSTEGK